MGEGHDFTVITNHYDHRSVMVILSNRDNIERHSAAIITSNGENEIKIQGKLENIIKAKTIIDTLLKNNVLLLDRRQESFNQINDLNSHGFISNSNYGEFGRDSGGTLPNDARFAFPNDSVPVFPGRNLYENDRQRFEGLIDSRGGVNGSPSPSHRAGSPYGYGLGNQSSVHGFNQFDFHAGVAELRVAANETDSSDSDSDEEREEEIKKDPDYPNKVEFALKLGYSEFDLLLALKKLGATAGQNELLSELIKKGSTLTKDSGTDGSKEVSPASLVEDPEDLQLFTYTRKKTGADDTTNLRPIVIDGSNVAMR